MTLAPQRRMVTGMNDLIRRGLLALLMAGVAAFAFYVLDYELGGLVMLAAGVVGVVLLALGLIRTPARR